MILKLEKSQFRNIFLLAIVALSLLLGWGGVSSAKEPAAKEEPSAARSKQEMVKTGKLYYDSREYEAAIAEWEKALSLDPKDKKTQKYISRAKKRLERKRKKEAAKEETEKKEALKSQEKRGLEAKKDRWSISHKEPKKKRGWFSWLFGRETGLISVTDIPPEMMSKLTIDDCINIAVQNSSQLKIAEKSIKLAELRLWESRRNLLPKVSVTMEQSDGRIYGRKYAGTKKYVEGEQVLPVMYGAETFFIMKQAEVNIKVMKEELRKAKSELIFQVKKSFYSLAKAKENTRLQADLEREVKDILERVKKENETSLISKLEFMNVSSQASQVDYQLTSARSDESLAALMLKHAMNINYRDGIDIALDPEFTKSEIDFDKALAVAFASRPEMRINSLTVEYNKYEKDISKSKGWPKITMMGNWGLAKEQFVEEDKLPTDPERKMEQQWYTGIKVSMPFWGSTAEYAYTQEDWVPVVSAYQGTAAITNTAKVNLWDKMGYYSDKVAAEVEHDKARQEMEKTKQDVTTEVREGCFNYEKALILLGAASRKVKYQEGDLEFVRFKRGMDEAQDSTVMESMIKLTQERFGYTQALMDCHAAVASINKAVGVDDYINSAKGMSGIADRR
jgi:outer membrane protein TolC